MTDPIRAAVEELCQLVPDWFRFTERRGVFPAAFEIRNVDTRNARHTWHTIGLEDGTAYPDTDTQHIRLIFTLLALCDSRGWPSTIGFDPQLEPNLRSQVTILGGGLECARAGSRVQALLDCTIKTLRTFSHQPATGSQDQSP